MSYRRGSSCGHVFYQPSSLTSEPSSDASEISFNRYPITRSGRGRGRGKIITEACSYYSQSHTARFHFPCSLGNSSFIVPVTVELFEDTVGLGAFSSGAVGPKVPLGPKIADKNDSTQSESTQQKDPGGPANQETTIHASPNTLEGVVL